MIRVDPLLVEKSQGLLQGSLNVPARTQAALFCSQVQDFTLSFGPSYHLWTSQRHAAARPQKTSESPTTRQISKCSSTVFTYLICFFFLRIKTKTVQKVRACFPFKEITAL